MPSGPRALGGTCLPFTGDRQLNLAPLRATNWKNIQLQHAIGLYLGKLQFRFGEVTLLSN